MRIREDYRTLTGAEKAAILMLSLSEDQTAKLFEHLDDEEIMEISQTMATLGKVSPVVKDALVDESGGGRGELDAVRGARGAAVERKVGGSTRCAGG